MVNTHPTSEYSWTKRLISNTFKVHHKGLVVGSLTTKDWDKSAVGMIDGSSYLFKPKGLLGVTVDVIRLPQHKRIAEISFATLTSEVTITTDKHTYSCHLPRLSMSHYTISSPEGATLRFASTTAKGSITTNSADPMLILAGLYITKHIKSTYYMAALTMLLTSITITEVVLFLLRS